MAPCTRQQIVTLVIVHLYRVYLLVAHAALSLEKYYRAQCCFCLEYVVFTFASYGKQLVAINQKKYFTIKQLKTETAVLCNKLHWFSSLHTENEISFFLYLLKMSGFDSISRLNKMFSLRLS